MADSTPDAPPYEPAVIEPKWQARWAEQRLFSASDDALKKFYCLMMFPYPSGTLHVGHGRNYILGDAVTRYKLMQGFSVMNPMGWDAFGLPAENHAIKLGRHPRDTTRDNIARMKEQLGQWGCGYDWEREFASCEPEYYRWTQWIFLQFYKRGLAYRKFAPVNWCPGCNTVLANEQVTADNRCERSGDLVEQREMEQWFYKITDYAERLLAGLDTLPDWPEPVKIRQRNWIGRSEGCFIDFPLVGELDAPDGVVPDAPMFPSHGTCRVPKGDPGCGEVLLRVFTTRPDTVYGVTFMALAPEHPVIEPLLTHPDCTLSDAEKDAVRAFVAECRQVTGFEREAEGGEKRGLSLGRSVKNPLRPDGPEIPLFVGNYVLMYGTGIVMAVPGHDTRDFDFAKRYGLRIEQVVEPPAGAPAEFQQPFADWPTAYTGLGISVNSGDQSGLATPEMQAAVAARLTERQRGGKTITYRLRDWLLSRQRYWGCPIPIVYCDACGVVPVPEDRLPVELPMDVDFKDRQGNPLAASPSFVQTPCPRCGAPARRETDTMDTFVDSSWYMLRFADARNDAHIFARDKADHWLPIDQYIGGSEHACGHLIYFRFFTKVLHDLGLTGFDEPAARLFTQGMICKAAHRCPNHNYLEPGEIAGADTDAPTCARCGAAVSVRIEKMSKSKHNVVDPAELIGQYGADTQRLYTLFIGPPIKDAAWNTDAVVGSYRFLNRLWEQVHRCLPVVIDAQSVARRNEPRAHGATDTNEPRASASGPDASANGLTEAGRTLRRATHGAIAAVTHDLEHDFGLNTAISRAMELSNALRDALSGALDAPAASPADRGAVREACVTLVQLLAPVVPHIAEELWAQFGAAINRGQSVFRSAWPVHDPAWLVAETIEVPVQVNGKKRATLTLPADADDAALEAAARADSSVKRAIGDTPVRKVIVVRKGSSSLVSIVARG